MGRVDAVDAVDGVDTGGSGEQESGIHAGVPAAIVESMATDELSPEM